MRIIHDTRKSSFSVVDCFFLGQALTRIFHRIAIFLIYLIDIKRKY